VSNVTTNIWWLLFKHRLESASHKSRQRVDQSIRQWIITISIGLQQAISWSALSSRLEADSADSFARECDFLPVLGNNQIYCRDGPSNKTEFSLWKTEVGLLIITCSSNFTKILMNLKKVRNRKYFVIVDPKTEMANKINGNTIFLIRSNWVYQNLNAFIQIFNFIIFI
jgi:Zn finger protein HypA/HybF involved in hydrogenase expression